MRLSNWLLPVSALALSAAVPLSACSSNKNHEEREKTPEAMAAKPDPSEAPSSTMIGQGLPDPGSRPIDCAKALGADRFEYAWAWDFAKDGKARATYTYDDNTPTVLLPPHNGWEPVPEPVPSCDGLGAAHFMGGTYTEYGGGWGLSFCTITNPCSNMPLPVSAEFPNDPEVDEQGNAIPRTGAYDLTGWTGVAVWIRRGPNGQPGLRVGVTERNSSEDLNTPTTQHPDRESKYCKRYRLCGCAPGITCSPTKPEAKDGYCWDPATDPPPNTQVNENNVPLQTLACGVFHCNQPNVSFAMVSFGNGLHEGVSDGEWASGADPLFVHRGCNPATQSDGHVDYFCYDPGKDPTPPAKRERCGNPFSRPITATLDWQLIRVPFTELRQADDMAVAGEIDLKSIKQLVFTHTTGNIDFYVGNVGFYKQR